MKKLLFVFIASATLSISTFAQAPEGFNYQAVVRDAGNIILTDQSVGMRMTIQQGAIGGTTVYSETFETTSNGYGLVNLQIGLGASSDDFSTIDWSTGPFFMETAIDFAGGSNYEVIGTSQLMSVPFALYAKTSGNGQGPEGPQGIQGPAGMDGTNGAVGAAGPTGATGVTGPQGIQGVAGNNGAAGVTGAQGIQGPAGMDGTNGAVGAAGPMGPQGNPGPVGEQGPAGIASTQNLQQVLENGNNANALNILNAGTIGVGTATPSAGASIEIATALPIIFPRMNQNQINALTPVEGMVQYNTDAKKLQVYGMLTDNADVLNEIYIGNESGANFSFNQSFSSPINGQVIAVELMFKNAFPDPIPAINFEGQGSYTVPSYSQFTWHTFVLTNPVTVFAGGFATFSFSGFGVFERSFATNSNYPNGELMSCCFQDDDVLFRIHIQPLSGSFGWQNLN